MATYTPEKDAFLMALAANFSWNRIGNPCYPIPAAAAALLAATKDAESAPKRSPDQVENPDDVYAMRHAVREQQWILAGTQHGLAEAQNEIARLKTQLGRLNNPSEKVIARAIERLKGAYNAPRATKEPPWRAMFFAVVWALRDGEE